MGEKNKILMKIKANNYINQWFNFFKSQYSLTIGFISPVTKTVCLYVLPIALYLSIKAHILRRTVQNHWHISISFTPFQMALPPFLYSTESLRKAKNPSSNWTHFCQPQFTLICSIWLHWSFPSYWHSLSSEKLY